MKNEKSTLRLQAVFKGKQGTEKQGEMQISLFRKTGETEKQVNLSQIENSPLYVIYGLIMETLSENEEGKTNE